jgi:phosphoadenosine phosphosulfate reductase
MGYGAWVIDVRREQSAPRARAKLVERNAENWLLELDWTKEPICQYILARELPYNLLHDRQFPSIGSSPCTRATQSGESRRAGRWWWDNPSPVNAAYIPEFGR